MEYSVSSYGTMIADSVRMDAYAAALERVVTPGSVVLDIGTGTGIAALLACRLGARRVFAVDPSPVIEVARQSVKDNGYADRVEFFEASSTRIDLPEPADVVVSDLHGVLPHYTSHLHVLEDARRRHLKPGGTLIPRQDIVWACLAEAPGEAAANLDVWRSYARGFDLDTPRALVSNQFWKAGRFADDRPLSAAHKVATLDYAGGVTGDLAAKEVFVADRDGLMHGLYLWFDTTLVEGIGFSNAPGEAEALYGRAFLPIPEAVPLSEGEQVAVNLAASFMTDDYIYRWDVRVGPADAPKARFRQSSFSGFPLSASALQTAGEGHVPQLGDEGLLARKALELMDGTRTVAEIADALAIGAGSREEALNAVTALSQKYSRRQGAD